MTDEVKEQQELDAMLKQQGELNAKIDAKLKATRVAALEKVRAACKNYKITASELKNALFVKRGANVDKTVTPRKSKTESS